MTHAFPESWSRLDVTLAHDWLTGMRGGERVLEVLCEGFPRAPIVSLLNVQNAVSDTIARHPIRTSWVQHIPGIARNYRYFLPVFPAAVHSLGVQGGDLLLSTSHCVAKAVRARPGTPHLCYCFTPMRYAWLFQREYLGGPSIRRLAAAPLLAALRHWDRRTSRRVTRFVGISRHVQERIQRFYGRPSDLVYPPVDTAFFTPASIPREDFDLIVSALVPYKRVDLAIEAYRHLNRRLKVVGIGGDLARLRASASGNVEFLGRQTDAAIRDLYRRARLLIFPGEEDFGIVPVEAQACGCPVIAYRCGGATETVIDGLSGLFFDRQDAAALAEAITMGADAAWQPEAIRAHAETFSTDRFIAGLSQSILNCLATR